jgi:hypothetical protein
MDFAAFKDWALLGLIAGGIWLLFDVLKKLLNSVELLNERVAVVIEKTNDHELRIEKLETKKENK